MKEVGDAQHILCNGKDYVANFFSHAYVGKLLYLIIGSVVGGVVLLVVLAIIVIVTAMCVNSSRKKARLYNAGTGVYITDMPAQIKLYNSLLIPTQYNTGPTLDPWTTPPT